MSKASAQIKMDEDDIRFFSDDDIHPMTGKPRSEYPAWYFNEHIEDLKESIRMSRAAIDSGAVRDSRLPQARADLSANETKLQRLLDNLPKITDTKLDRIAAVRRELSDKIKESLFTRTDMMKGLADAHEEARRMIENLIELRDDAYKFAVGCGCNPVEGRFTRNDVSKTWKILSKILGENTNVEYLRQD